MKKEFKFYASIWMVLFVLFNVVLFLGRAFIPGFVTRFGVSFWITWALILIAFGGNLACAFIAFKSDNLQKTFYSLPLITVSWSALIAMMIIGCGILLVPVCPDWIAVIVCGLILAANAIAVVGAAWAGSSVNRVDEKVKAQTSFIRNLIVDMESILSRAKSEAVKAECKRVYEAARYSDPMSNEALSMVEAKIIVKVDEFSSTVGADDLEKAKAIADEIIVLIGDRNKKCKQLKQ